MPRSGKDETCCPMARQIPLPAFLCGIKTMNASWKVHYDEKPCGMLAAPLLRVWGVRGNVWEGVAWGVFGAWWTYQGDGSERSVSGWCRRVPGLSMDG